MAQKAHRYVYPEKKLVCFPFFGLTMKLGPVAVSVHDIISLQKKLGVA